MSKNVIEKIINNGIEYYLPEQSGGGGDLDIGAVNALIDMKLGDYDSLFSVTNGLYKILNSIDTEDEIGLTGGDTWNEIVADDTSMSLISHCYAVMCYIANSYKAMSTILADASATDEISECWNSISIIAECELAANLYLASVNGITSLFKYNTAQDAFFTSTARKTQIITQNIMVIVNDNTLLASLIDDPIVKSVICNSQNALNTIAGDSDKLDIVENDTTIMNTIANNSGALGHMSDSDFFEYILENETYLATCAAGTNGKAKINSYAADDLLDPIYFWTGDLGYSTFAELAADDTSMEIVQANSNAMLIINNNQNCMDLLPWTVFYQQCEYIQSTGDQVIKSGVYIDSTGYRATVDFQITSTSKSDQCICGFYVDGSSFAYRVGYGQRDNFSSTQGVSSTSRQTATGSTISSTYSSYQILIFAKQRYSDGRYDSGAIAKLYSLQIYKNNVLVRDYVPVYRKSDNKPGLFDKTNEVFYVNEGSGDFTAGPNV